MQANCETQCLGYVEGIHRKMRNLTIKCADSDLFKAAMNNELQAHRESLGIEDRSSVVRRVTPSTLNNLPDSSVSARVTNNHTFSPRVHQLKPNPPSLSESLQNTAQNTICKGLCDNASSAFNPLPWQSDQMQALSKLNSSSENRVSTTTATGSRLEVRAQSETDGYALTSTRKDGTVVSFDITENARLLELKDGGFAVTLTDSGKRFVVNPDGSIRNGEDAEFEGADEIFVNLTGSTVDGGDGNDIILNFANNATIKGGSGNDTIVLASGQSNLTVDAGEGNDTLSGGNLSYSSVTMGDGNEQVGLNEISQGSSITLGNGNNSVQIHSVLNGSNVTLGNGNNTIAFSTISNGSSVVVGNGNNTTVGGTVENGSSLAFGNGNNNLRLYEIVNGSTVHLGNGNNNMNLYEVENGSALATGNGNNNLDVYEVETGSHVHAGNGNNTANIYEIQGGSQVQLGNGDNLAVLYKLMSNGSFSMGTGSNRATVQEENGKIIQSGHGKLHFDTLIHGAQVITRSGSPLYGHGDSTAQA